MLENNLIDEGSRPATTAASRTLLLYFASPSMVGNTALDPLGIFPSEVNSSLAMIFDITAGIHRHDSTQTSSTGSKSRLAYCSSGPLPTHALGRHWLSSLRPRFPRPSSRPKLVESPTSHSRPGVSSSLSFRHTCRMWVTEIWKHILGSSLERSHSFGLSLYGFAIPKLRERVLRTWMCFSCRRS
jgi:hypothetical protein